MQNRSLIAWKPIMTVGAIAGGALIFINLLFYVTGRSFENYNTLNFLQFVIVVLLLIFGGKYLRDNFYNGEITYSRIFLISLLMLIFTSFILSFYKYLLFGFIDVDLMSEYFQFMEDKVLEAQDGMLQLGMSDSNVEKYTAPMLENVKTLKNEATPLSLAQADVFNITFWGGIIALITSIFIKKKKNIFETEI